MEIDPIHLADGIHPFHKQLLGAVIFQQSYPEVVEGLLTDMGSGRLDAKGVLPLKIKLEVVEHLRIGEIIV